MKDPRTERSILFALAKHGPMTAAGLTEHLGLDSRYVFNLCSSMSGAGLLSEHPNERNGRRNRRYGAAVAIHPSDRRTVTELTVAYGAKVMRRLVRECQS